AVAIPPVPKPPPPPPSLVPPASDGPTQDQSRMTPPVPLPATPARPPDDIVPASCDVAGKVVRDFALPDLDRNEWRYAKEQRHRVVLLHFWRTGDGACLQQLPALRALHRAYRDYDFEVVGVAYE